MIIRSVVSAVLLLVLYTILIISFQGYVKHSGQTTLQRNMVKAEDYLFEANGHFDTVLVGSSMSERLIMDSLPRGCYNLAMAGFSSLDGLQLIKQSTHWPRLIYIELNTLDRGHTSDAIQEFNDSRQQFLKQYFPFMRQKYQPIGVIKSLLRDWKYSQAQFVDFGISVPFDTTFQEKAIQEKLKEMEYVPADSSLRKDMQIAGNYIDAFRRKGVKVIFFELPIDIRLQNHRRTAVARQYLSNRFSASQYPIINAPADAYLTNDGIHLTRSENIRYTVYLSQKLHQLADSSLLSNSTKAGTGL